MNGKPTRRFAFLALVSLLVGARADAQVNGGFENPVVPVGGFNTYSTGSSFAGWTVVGAPGNVTVVSGAYTCCSFGYTFQARSGAQWLDLTGATNTATGILQNMTTTMGSQYNLSFWIGNVFAPNSGLVSSSINVVIDGTSAGVFTNAAGSPNMVNWQQYFVSFTAGSNSTVVELYNADLLSDALNGLDDVLLTETTATPEPASMLLFATGLGVLGLGARRKRKS